MTPTELRTLAQFHAGRDLQARMAHAEEIIQRQREALAWAADEIDRLRAECERCKSTPPAV